VFAAEQIRIMAELAESPTPLIAMLGVAARHVENELRALLEMNCRPCWFSLCPSERSHPYSPL